MIEREKESHDASFHLMRNNETEDRWRGKERRKLEKVITCQVSIGIVCSFPSKIERDRIL